MNAIQSLALAGLTLSLLNVSPLPTTAQTRPENARCPAAAGGGSLLQRFSTETHDIYICQGGTGRQDWRELDYYGVNRQHPQAALRLRAYLSAPGYYAVNGITRYEINHSFLTITQQGRTLAKQTVLRCVDGLGGTCLPNQGGPIDVTVERQNLCRQVTGVSVGVRPFDVQIDPGTSVNAQGLTTVNWRVSSYGMNGYCRMNAAGTVTEFRAFE